MRTWILGGALVLMSTLAASAQPYFGPGYGYGPGPGYGPPPPPPPHFGGYGPPPGYWRGPPVRCWWQPTPGGPRRVCRRAW